MVVEGTEGSACNVYAFERGEAGWELRVQTAGWLGLNGMSNHRTEGDKTTPIGVFQMNTPFGQDDPLDGFPSNYIKVDETYIWDQYATAWCRTHPLPGSRWEPRGTRSTMTM